MLCCVLLCGVVLCFVVWCCVVLCGVVLCCVVFYCVVLCCVVWCCVVLCCVVLCCVVLCFVVLCSRSTWAPQCMQHVSSIFLLIYFLRDATLHSSFISGKLLYISRVASLPIIRSTHLHLHIWYLLTFAATCLYCGRVGQPQLCHNTGRWQQRLTWTLLTYLLTPWSRVLLEKLTCKFCR